jgi:hypothetical protein
MENEIQIKVPVEHADELSRIATLLRDRDKARQSNDFNQQRALRQLIYERLEEELGKLFPEVYAAANEAAALTRDLVERGSDRAPRYQVFDSALLDNDLEAAHEAGAILAHFLIKAVPRLPPGLGEAAASAFWLKAMGEETWLGRRAIPDGGRIAFRNRLLFGLIHYEWGYNSDGHKTRGEAADSILAGFPRIAITWESLEREASPSRGDFVAVGRYCEKLGRRDRAIGADYNPPYAGYRAALALKAGDFLRREQRRSTKSRKS